MGCFQSKAVEIDVPPTLPVATPSAVVAAGRATPASVPPPPVMVSSATTSSRKSNQPPPMRRQTHSGEATSHGSTIHRSGTVPSPPSPLIASGAGSGVHPHEVSRYGLQTPPVLSPALETATSVPSPSPDWSGTPAHNTAQRVTGTTAHLPPKPSTGTSKHQQLDPDGTRVVPSSYRGSVRKTVSALPLLQSEIPSPVVARTVSSSGHLSNANPEITIQSHSSSIPGTNNLLDGNRGGHRRFTPTVRRVFSDNPRFRILIVGKTDSGKSSLINSIFKVDMPRKTVPENERRTVDINVGFIPPENRRLIVHECSAFQSGVGQNIQTILRFITSHTGPSCPASERLHAIWICVPTSDVIESKLGEGVAEILRQNVVPVVLVATKFDLVVNRVLSDMGGKAHFYERARANAHGMYEQSCHTLFPGNPRNIPAETVSTWPRFGDLFVKLITTTHRLITMYSHETREGNAQIHSTPFVWSVAQRFSDELIIQATIEVGYGRYWRSLWSSRDFTNQILEDCVDVVHTDIVEVWSLDDGYEYLLGREFRDQMSALVRDLVESQMDPSAGSRLNRIPAARRGSNIYQNSIENIRYMMGYIVDLTVILRSIFVSGHDVSASKIHEAMNHHVVSGLHRRIHRDIRQFVTEANSFAHSRNDPIIGKITELIRQSCTPHSGSN
ncbi:hypothetical protein BJV74DRAFT_860737 [Russula compacta]|nr:hypothetical protein BJV74DRAFT_860737 [Russula compacta]